MDEPRKKAVKKKLEGMIVKNPVEKIIRPKATKSWSQRFKKITDRLAKGAKHHTQREIDKMIDEAVVAVRAKKHARN